MLNHESEIFTIIKDAVTAEYSAETVNFGTVTTDKEPRLPFVYMEVHDQYERPGTIDSSDIEKYRNIALQVDIYSKRNRQQTIDIAEIVAAAMRQKNFRLTAMAPMQVGVRKEIFRRTLRFEGTVSDDHFYGR